MRKILYTLCKIANMYNIIVHNLFSLQCKSYMNSAM